jgi:hypothetical protein
VRAGGEEIAAEIGHAVCLDAKTVHAINEIDDLISINPTGIDLGDTIGDSPHRKLESRTRMNPRSRDEPRFGPDLPDDRINDAVNRSIAYIVCQRKAPPRRPCPLGLVADRLVRRVIVEIARDHFLVGANAEAVDRQRCSHGRAARQRDLVGRCAHI